MFQSDVYVKRRENLRKQITSGVILFLGNVESPMNYGGNTYRFRQDSSFLYFFGYNQPNIAGVIDIEAGTDCLYGDNMNLEDIIWSGNQTLMIEKGRLIGISSVHGLNELQRTITSAIKKGRKIHFLPPYRGENKIMLSSLLGINIEHLRYYVSNKLIKAIVKLRSEKEECEIEEIENACNTGYEMHVTAMQMCKPGIMEHEIAGTIEGIAMSKNGAVSFPIILSQNSQILHNHNHNGVLKEGRLMLTDAGAETAMGYASDFTRTIPVGGKFSNKQKDIYNIVLAANNKAISMSKPGVFYRDVHLEASRVIASGLKDLGLMTGDVDEAVAQGAHALFFPHGLGHMMGLDVHDMEDLGENNVGYDEEITRSEQFGTAYLRMGRRLKKNYVLTVEPGIYFIPTLIEKWETERINAKFINFNKVKEYIDFGGIRLEDDILITEHSCRILGKHRVPITPGEIEDIMLN